MAYDNSDSFYNDLLLENIDNTIPLLRNTDSQPRNKAPLVPQTVFLH